MSDPTTPAEAALTAAIWGMDLRDDAGSLAERIIAALPPGSALVTTETLAAALHQFDGTVIQYGDMALAAAIIEALRTTQGDDR